MKEHDEASEIEEAVQTPFNGRLRELVAHDKPYPWADKIGIPRSTFRRIWSGGSLPRAETLVTIKEATGASIDWLLTGKGDRQAAENAVAEVPISFQNLALIPRLNVSVSAGPGAALPFNENVLSSVALPADWVRRTFGFPPEELAIIEAMGDSMSPTISPGEPVLVHTNVAEMRPDGIYVIDMGGSLNLKRVQILSGNRLRISSDNKSYPEEILSTEEASFVTIHARALIGLKRLS